MGKQAAASQIEKHRACWALTVRMRPGREVPGRRLGHRRMECRAAKEKNMEPMRSSGTGISQRRRVEAVVDTLANIYREDESLA